MTMVLTIATLLGTTSWGGVQTGELVGMGSGFAPEGLYEINIDTGEAENQRLAGCCSFNRLLAGDFAGQDGDVVAGMERAVLLVE